MKATWREKESDSDSNSSTTKRFVFFMCSIPQLECFLFLQFLVHFYSEVLLIGSFNFNFSSQYILLGLTLCNTSNIMYYTVVLCHKLVSCSGVINRE